MILSGKVAAPAPLVFAAKLALRHLPIASYPEAGGQKVSALREVSED